MSQEPVLCQVTDGIAVLTLNNPRRQNALSNALLRALHGLLGEIKDDPAVRVVVLRSEGPVFSSGHDLSEMIDGDREAYAGIFEDCTVVMESIRLLPKPVIAQVQGLATAAGCQLVATCDLAIASETAGFATPGVHIGLFCTTPGVAVSRAVMPKKAMEMLLTGDPISAQEALEFGLVNRVVPPEEPGSDRDGNGPEDQFRQFPDLGHRQVGLLPAVGNGPSGGLQVRPGRDGGQPDGRGRQGGDHRLPGQAGSPLELLTGRLT